MPARADGMSVRRNNLYLILRHLAVRGPASRAAIAANTGLTRATVSRLVGELLAQRLVHETGVNQSSQMGRPGTQLDLDGRHVLVVGAEVDVDGFTVLVTDLAGRQQHLVRKPVDVVTLGKERAVRQLANLCRRAVADVCRSQGDLPVKAFAIAVPGSVDSSRRTIIDTPNLKWRTFPLAHAVAETLGWSELISLLENEANLAALAEYWTGPHSGTRNFIYISGSVGIGGGVVVDGRLISAAGRAGAVGHMMVDRDGPLCGCGRRGCWESRIGLNAFLRSAHLPPVGQCGPDASIRAVIEQAQAGKESVLRALAALGEWVGVGAANLINLLGFDVVILGGYLAAVAEWILPSAGKSLQEQVAVPLAGQELIVASTLGMSASARGAALEASNMVIANALEVRGSFIASLLPT